MIQLIKEIAQELKERSDFDAKYGYYTSHTNSMCVLSNTIYEQLSLSLSPEDCINLLKIIKDVIIKWQNEIHLHNQLNHNVLFFQSTILKIQEKL